MKDLTESAKEICRLNSITTDEKLREVVKEIKITMRLDHGIKSKEYNKLSISEILEWQVNERKKDPISG